MSLLKEKLLIYLKNGYLYNLKSLSISKFLYQYSYIHYNQYWM